MKCQNCDKEMTGGFIYLRGLGVSLHWATSKDISILTRKGLERMDLGKMSVVGIGKQAIIEALRCDACQKVTFNTQSVPR